MTTRNRHITAMNQQIHARNRQITARTRDFYFLAVQNSSRGDLVTFDFDMYFWECILCSDHWPIRIWLRILKIYSEDSVLCVSSVAIPSSADWNVRINHGNEKCIIMLRLRMYFEFTIENVLRLRMYYDWECIVCFNPSEVRSLISWLEQNSRHRPKMPITIQFQFVNFLFATWKHCSSK